MAANKAYLEQLLETNRFYGGNNTVEQCIRLNDHDNWLENGGYVSYDESGVRDDVLDAFGV